MGWTLENVHLWQFNVQLLNLVEDVLDVGVPVSYTHLTLPTNREV